MWGVGVCGREGEVPLKMLCLTSFFFFVVVVVVVVVLFFGTFVSKLIRWNICVMLIRISAVIKGNAYAHTSMRPLTFLFCLCMCEVLYE